MENLFEKLKEANKKMPTIPLKQNKYVQVKDRIVGFRSIYPDGTILTESLPQTDNYCYFKATIKDSEGKVLATGHSRVLLSKEKALEKAETEAVGRALAYMGLGTSESIASYEEMKDEEEISGAFDEDTELKKKLVDKFNKLDINKQAEVLNMFRVKSPEQLKVDTLKDIVNG